jgi:hypothetical protein
MRVTRFYRKRSAAPGTKSPSFSAKDWLSLIISMAAFALSGLTTYMNVVRTSDYVSVIATTNHQTIPRPNWVRYIRLGPTGLGA